MKIEWLVPDQLLFIRVGGTANLERIREMDRLLIRCLNTAQPHPVMLLADFRNVNRIAIEPSVLMRGVGYYRHSYFKGQVVYGLAPAPRAYLRALTEMMNRMSRRHYHLCDTYEAAVELLVERHLIVTDDLDHLAGFQASLNLPAEAPSSYQRPGSLD